MSWEENVTLMRMALLLLLLDFMIKLITQTRGTSDRRVAYFKPMLQRRSTQLHLYIQHQPQPSLLQTSTTLFINFHRNGNIKCSVTSLPSTACDALKSILHIYSRYLYITLFYKWQLYNKLISMPCYKRGYRGGSPTAVQAWQTCPLWEPSPSHPILV